ncbi:MAG TPA: 2-dehydropantoate 2-reductase N-terminal domain-containing protein, partial [Bacillales bacterium]
MNIVILGAGAVGGYIGGRLEEAGVPVSFLVRERRAEQLRKNGMRISSVHGDYSTESMQLHTDAEQISECDLVIVTVKGYQVEGALPQLRTLAAKGAKVLPFLNGMEHFQLFEEAFGKENVLGGLAFIISTLDENGGIVQTSKQHD